MQLMASLKVTETLETKVMDSAATTPCATPVTDAARPLIQQQQPQKQQQQQEQQLQQAAQEQVSQDEVKEAKLLGEEGDTGKQGVIEDDHKDDEPIVQSVSESVDVVEVLVITDNDGEQSLTESTRGEDAASETSGVSENVPYKDNCSPDEGYGPDIASAMSEEVVEDQAEGSEQTEISKSDEVAEATAEKDVSHTQMKTSESGIEIPAIEISPVEEEAKLPFQLGHSRSESTMSDIEATTAIAVLEQAVQQAYESMTKQAESNDPLDEPEEVATGDDQVVPDVSSSVPKDTSDSEEVKDAGHGDQKEEEKKDGEVENEAVEEDAPGMTGDGEDEGGLGSGQASTESLSTDL